MARSLKQLTVSNSPMPVRSHSSRRPRSTNYDVDVKIAVSIMPVKVTAHELFGPEGTPRVVVVGAGIGGIATGVKLKRAGIDTFTIYESSLGIGGTWWDNTYPGAEVDVGSHLYCFSFKPHHWTRTHARQPELQKYLEETVDEFGLRPHLRLGVTAASGTWNPDHPVAARPRELATHPAAPRSYCDLRVPCAR